MKKYVTYLVTYSGDKLPKYYVGSTSEEKASSGRYFGSVSSKKYKSIFSKEIMENPNLFKIDILTYHNSREDALIEELKIQIELDVVKSVEYMNESFARVNGFFGRDISGENHPNYGNYLSHETKDKISNSLKGRIESEETRNKKSESKLGDRNSFYGKRHSEETKDKISKTKQGCVSWNKGVPMSEESKKKLSESKKGKITSEETKKKLSELRKGKPKSQETKDKMRLAWIERKKRKEEIIKKYKMFLEKNNTEIPLPNDIIEISNAYIKSGKDIFLVGGAVRDFIQGIEPKDWDLVTNALPDESKQILKGFNVSDEQGKNFGVLRVYTKDEPEGYEIASYRRDISGGRDTKGDDQKVEMGGDVTIEDDCNRRDLTMNALFYDIKNKKIVDLVGGIDDIKNGIVRAVGDASQRFIEDRLRILRIFRFASRTGGEIDQKTEDAIKKDNRLKGVGPKDDVSQERVWEEMRKAFKQAKDYNYYLSFFTKFDMWKEVFPGSAISKPFQSESIEIVVASLFRDNPTQGLEKKMVQDYKIEHSIAKKAVFLIEMLQFDPDSVLDFYKKKESAGVSAEMLLEWLGKAGIGEPAAKLAIWKPTVSAEELMAKGIKGKALGIEIKRLEAENFNRK